MARVKKKVVIVMPAYQAAKTLRKTYEDIPDKLRIKKNILVVDDASSDNTAQIAKTLGLKVIQHDVNKGYGGNQKTCYKEALKLDPDVVVMLHPDYQYDASMMNELIRPIKDGWLDIMLGNRIRTRRETLKGGMPKYKYFSNRALTILENIVLGLNLGEYHTGYRAYSKKVLKNLPISQFSDDFVFDQEILISAAYHKFNIGQIPVPVRYFAEASSIDFVNSFKYGLETILVLLKYIITSADLYRFRIFK